MKIIICCFLLLSTSLVVNPLKLKKSFDFNFGKFAQNLNNGSKKLTF